MKCQWMRFRPAQRIIALLWNSGPLSDMITSGRPLVTTEDIQDSADPLTGEALSDLDLKALPCCWINDSQESQFMTR